MFAPASVVVEPSGGTEELTGGDAFDRRGGVGGVDGRIAGVTGVVPRVGIHRVGVELGMTEEERGAGVVAAPVWGDLPTIRSGHSHHREGTKTALL